MSRVGLLLVMGPDVPGNALKEYEPAARALKIQLESIKDTSAKPRPGGRISRGGERARERGHNAFEFRAHTPPEKDHGPGYKEPAGFNARKK